MWILLIIKPIARMHGGLVDRNSGYKTHIKGFNIPTVEVDGYEADDVVGTLSKTGCKAGYEVFMVTPD